MQATVNCELCSGLLVALPRLSSSYECRSDHLHHYIALWSSSVLWLYCSRCGMAFSQQLRIPVLNFSFELSSQCSLSLPHEVPNPFPLLLFPILTMSLIVATMLPPTTGLWLLCGFFFFFSPKEQFETILQVTEDSSLFCSQ